MQLSKQKYLIKVKILAKYYSWLKNINKTIGPSKTKYCYFLRFPIKGFSTI